MSECESRATVTSPKLRCTKQRDHVGEHEGADVVLGVWYWSRYDGSDARQWRQDTRAAAVDDYARAQGASLDAFRLEAARLILSELDRIAGAGVRVLEVGDGPTRIRVELEPQNAPSLIRRQVRDMLRQSAPGHPGAKAPQDDPEQADEDDQPDADADEADAATTAGDDLDLAHVK